MTVHSSQPSGQSINGWPWICAVALALSVVGCGTTPRQASPEANAAPQTRASETADSGKNEGSAEAVRTAGRVAGATALGVAGAAGGAVLGAVGGFAVGGYCGPLVIVCGPVMAVGGAILGGVAGGVGGARYVWKATASDGDDTHDRASGETAGEAPTVVTQAEESAPPDSQPDLSTSASDEGSDRELGTEAKMAAESHAEAVEDAAGPVALAATSASPAVAPQSAESPTAELRNDPSGTAPGQFALAAGTSWAYRFSDRIYTQNRARFTVEVVRAENGLVQEHLLADPGSAPAPAAWRAIDTRDTRFSEYRLGANEELLEFAPYLLAAGGEEALRHVSGAAGYPTSGYSGWVIRTTAPIREQVTVPAGTFDALRLEISGRREISPFSPIAIYHFSVRIWYAPEVKRYVKLEHKTWLAGPKPYGDEVVELVNFTPPSQPAGSPRG